MAYGDPVPMGMTSGSIGGSWPQANSEATLEIAVEKDLGITVDNLLKRRDSAYKTAGDLQSRLRRVNDEIRVLDIAILGIQNALEPQPEEVLDKAQTSLHST